MSTAGGGINEAELFLYIIIIGSVVVCLAVIIAMYIFCVYFLLPMRRLQILRESQLTEDVTRHIEQLPEEPLTRRPKRATNRKKNRMDSGRGSSSSSRPRKSRSKRLPPASSSSSSSSSESISSSSTTIFTSSSSSKSISHEPLPRISKTPRKKQKSIRQVDKIPQTLNESSSDHDPGQDPSDDSRVLLRASSQSKVMRDSPRDVPVQRRLSLPSFTNMKISDYAAEVARDRQMVLIATSPSPTVNMSAEASLTDSLLHTMDTDKAFSWQSSEYVRLDAGELSVKRSDVEICKQIGQGAFAKVYMGRLKMPDGKFDVVAVKELLTEDEDVAELEQHRQTFKREINLMKSMKPHPNVLNLIGMCADKTGPLWIITEFCPGGSLLGYLRKLRSNQELLGRRQTIDLMLDTALGIRHLHEQNIVHRDIAARNMLLTHTGKIKVSDFGLSRNTLQDGFKTKSKTGPLRWMAVESLVKREYSPQSDVWAYGVLMWEIETRGLTPYFHIRQQIDLVLQIVRQGLRLPSPAQCPAVLVHLMDRCWNEQPTKRPTIQDVVEILRILKAEREALYAQRPILSPMASELQISEVSTMTLPNTTQLAGYDEIANDRQDAYYLGSNDALSPALREYDENHPAAVGAAAVDTPSRSSSSGQRNNHRVRSVRSIDQRQHMKQSSSYDELSKLNRNHTDQSSVTSDGVPSGRRTVDAVTQQRYDKVTRVTKPLAVPAAVRKTKSKHRRGSKTSSLTTLNNQTAHYERVPAENPTQLPYDKVSLVSPPTSFIPSAMPTDSTKLKNLASQNQGIVAPKPMTANTRTLAQSANSRSSTTTTTSSSTSSYDSSSSSSSSSSGSTYTYTYESDSESSSDTTTYASTSSPEHDDAVVAAANNQSLSSSDSSLLEKATLAQLRATDAATNQDTNKQLNVKESSFLERGKSSPSFVHHIKQTQDAKLTKSASSDGLGFLTQLAFLKDVEERDLVTPTRENEFIENRRKK